MSTYRDYRRARFTRLGALTGVLWRRFGWFWPRHHANLIAASEPGDIERAW